MEKAQEYYYKEAIASLNAGNKVSADLGETWQLKNELTLLTRGADDCRTPGNQNEQLNLARRD